MTIHTFVFIWVLFFENLRSVGKIYGGFLLWSTEAFRSVKGKAAVLPLKLEYENVRRLLGPTWTPATSCSPGLQIVLL